MKRYGLIFEIWRCFFIFLKLIIEIKVKYQLLDIKQFSNCIHKCTMEKLNFKITCCFFLSFFFFILV